MRALFRAWSVGVLVALGAGACRSASDDATVAPAGETTSTESPSLTSAPTLNSVPTLDSVPTLNPVPIQGEPAQPEPAQGTADPSGHGTLTEPSTAEPSGSEASNSEPSTAEPSGSEASNSEPSTAEPSDSGASSSGPSSSEPSEAEPSASGPVIPDAPSGDCGSTKWACWRMPNPVGSGLPNEASTTNNGDGTVTDTVTGLVWEETENAGKVTWQGAIDYCDNLELGSYSDWRAPSRIEMTSLVDFSQAGTKVDPDSFPNPPGAWHRTASVWILTINGKSTLDVAWTFNLSDGIVSNNFNRADDGAVRCVRSDGTGEAPEAAAVAPAEQYTLLSDDEARDNYTGLVWQRHDSAAYLAWAAAADYCADLELGGAVWRLPSIRELATLVDEAQVAPAINREVFPGTIGKSKSNDWYWASHQAVGSDAAWAINFDDGFTGFNAGQAGAWNAFSAGYARCVRSE